MTKRVTLAAALPELDALADATTVAFGPIEGEQRKQIIVRVPPSIHQDFMVLAARRSTKMQTLLVAAIERMLDEDHEAQKGA